MRSLSVSENLPPKTEDASPRTHPASVPVRPCPPFFSEDWTLKRATTEPSLAASAKSRASRSLIRKTVAKLRLPPFEQLGIAVPHPDRLHNPTSPRVVHVAATLEDGNRPRWEVTQSRPGQEGASLDAARASDDAVAPPPSPFASRHLLSQSPLVMLTPPDDTVVMDWTTESAALMGSSSSSTHLPEDVRHSMSTASQTGTEPIAPGPTSAPNPRTSETTGVTREPAQGPGRARCAGESPFLTEALQAILPDFIRVNSHGNATRVLAHTLPRSLDSRHLRSQSPSSGATPSFSAPTAVIPLIDAIKQRSAEHGGTSYIHVTYAAEFAEVNLGYLPSSPPLTAGGVVQGAGPMSPGYFSGLPVPTGQGSSPGYFAPMIFNSVVFVLPPVNVAVSAPPRDLESFDEWAEQQRRAPLPKPNLVTPPLSQDVSVLERYIPPSLPEDDQRIFSNSASTLVDRLSELSVGGTLLFIYPTKQGAETFAQKYLGPAISPILRRLMTSYSLPVHFCENVERMRAVEFMKEFLELKAMVENICQRSRPVAAEAPPTSPWVSSGVTAAEVAGQGYQLISSSAATVRLLPEMWQEWWSKQEKPRIANIVKHLTRFGFVLPTELMNGELERRVINGVYPPPGQHRQGPPPQSTLPAPDECAPIEVGVFVIQKLG